MANDDIGFGPLKGLDPVYSTGFNRLANGCVSTVGAALPSFAGRAIGDLHSIPDASDPTRAAAYVVTGLSGRVFSDTFNRVNSSLIGRGWMQAGGDFYISSNKARTVSASASLLQNFGREDLDVTATVDGGGQPGVIAWTTTANGILTGYRAQVSLSATGTNVLLLKTNAQVAAGHAGAAGAALTTPPVVLLSIRGLVVTVYVNAVLILTYTDTAGSQPGGAYSGVFSSSASDNGFDNVTISTPGSMGWVNIGGAAFKSTVAAGLPTFAGRKLGDLHYDLTTAKEYVLTGVEGSPTATENFERANGTDLGGLTTTTGGKTWRFISGTHNAPGQTGPQGTNQLRCLDGGTELYNANGFLQMGDGAQEATITFKTGLFAGNTGVWFRSNGETINSAGLFTGYFVNISAAGNSVAGGHVRIRRGGPNGTSIYYSTASLPAQFAQVTYTFRISAHTTNPVITLLVNNVAVHSVTDTANTSPVYGDWIGLYAEGNGGPSSGYYESVLDFSCVATGTQAWTYTGGSAIGAIQDEGVNLAQRSTLNFIGGAVTAADDSVNARTNVTINAPQSTVGAGLPAVATRSPADLHFNLTDATEYVLTGAAGTSNVDDFNRSDRTPLGALPSGGKTWEYYVINNVPQNWSIISNAATNNLADSGNNNHYQMAAIPTSGDFDVTWVVKKGSNDSYCIGRVAAMTQFTGGMPSSYFIGPRLNFTECWRPGPSGPIYIATGSNNVEGTTYTYRIVRSGTSLSYYKDNVLIASATDTNPIDTGYTGMMAMPNANGYAVDSFTCLETGTLAWKPVVVTPAAAIPLSTATTKGDMLAATGPSAITRVPVGANTYVLTADSTSATGVAWAAPAAGGAGGHVIKDEGTSLTARAALDFVGAGVTVTDDAANNKSIVTIPGGGGGGGASVSCRVYRSAALTIPITTWTTIPWDAESFDDNGLHDLATNPSRVTIATPGKYVIAATVRWGSAFTGNYRGIRVLKNGSTVTLESYASGTGLGDVDQVLDVVDCAAGDFLEIQAYNERTGGTALIVSSAQTAMSVLLLGSGGAAVSKTGGVYRGTAYSPTTNADTPLPWVGTTGLSTYVAGDVWVAGNPTRLVIPETGLFVVTWNIPIDVGSSPGVIAVGARINGGGYTAVWRGTPSSINGTVVLEATSVLNYVAGDYIELTLNFPNGSTCALSGGYYVNPIMSISKVVSTGGGGGSALSVQDENVTLSSAVTQLDFQGAGVTAALVGSEIVVTIPGGGGGSYLEFTQATAAATWIITHNFGKRPAVVVTDASGNELLADVIHSSANQVSVVHGDPTAGFAYLNA